MIVGCYSMDLYCDTGGDAYGGKCPHSTSYTTVQAEFTGRNERDCLQQAKQRGWSFRNGKATCPGCNDDKSPA
jgi:hypothetical protein